jgi:hypothetical protein
MKTISKFFWLIVLLFVVGHGANVIRNEWQRKSIHDHGEMVEVKIEKLNCSDGIMTFYLGTIRFEKNIDTRTCALLNEGQEIRLRHSEKFSDTFLFVNERSPNRFILGGLEILVGLIGLLANWPLSTERSANRNLPGLSDN